MDLRTWISADLDSLRNRLSNGVLAIIPPDRMAERVDGGGVPAVYVAWHTARHHDLAVNGVLRRCPEVLEEWSTRVGVDTDTWRGLAEGEDHDLVTALDPEAVAAYALAVIDHTKTWIADGDLSILDTVPDSAAALRAIGTPEDRFDWLYSMWDGKPAAFFLSWEAVGHGYNHLGELTAVRNRMGLSPF
jgi:hypothetical protein